MGHSSWSDTFYTSRKANLRAAGKTHFAYNADIKSGKVDKKCHDNLNPYGVKNRESRDSDAHPNSKAIGILFDVTGSMGRNPIILQEKLGGLMKLLLQKGYMEDPHVLFGGIGDANNCDEAPLQIGQFEAGIESDDDLSKFWLEGGGCGGMRESYELAAYFMSRHTSIDCFDKRREKGYLFLVGDEMCYDAVDKDQVSKLIGDGLQEDISTKEIFKELEDKYDVFFIYINSGSYGAGGKEKVIEHWKEILPERVIDLENAEEVCEVIASTIAMCEGVADLDTAMNDLKDVGLSASPGVKNALVKIGTGSKGNLVSVSEDIGEGESQLENI